MIKNWLLSLLLVLLVSFFSCKLDATSDKSIENEPVTQRSKVTHAEGFAIRRKGELTEIEVNDPWPNAKKSFTYAVLPKTSTVAVSDYDAVIRLPIEKVIVTSTTHIPALESLGVLNKLKGFPETKYISSMPTRMRIQKGYIKELGSNENLNTEMVIALKPDVVVGFAINNNNAQYTTLKNAGIPVLFNGDWVEKNPLGKAEWIKFFGVLFGKEQEADSIFKDIAQSYKKAKELAKKARNRPTVMSGAMYKDVWYLPAGQSWMAQFFKDAHAEYLYATTEGTGSLSLSVENVLETSTAADFWVAPGQFTSYEELLKANDHYVQFKAFKNRKIYSFSNTLGASGGVLFYELAPQRPDLVLKDLVKIFHPELLPEYKSFFYSPLE